MEVNERVGVAMKATHDRLKISETLANKTIMPLKIFWTNGFPVEADVQEALEVCYKEKCRARIEYMMYGYPYAVALDYTNTLEEIIDRIPTVYGM